MQRLPETAKYSLVSATIAALAAARATRFVTSDFLGEWLFVARLKTWSSKKETAEIVRRTTALGNVPRVKSASGIVHVTTPANPDDLIPPYSPNNPFTWQAKLTKGLDCPFCVGFWIGALVLLGNVTLGRLPIVGPVWRFGLAAFALNYVVGHVSSRIDG